MKKVYLDVVGNNPWIGDYKLSRQGEFEEISGSVYKMKWTGHGETTKGFLRRVSPVETNVMTSIWPQEYPALYTCSPYFDDNQFTKPNQTYVLPESVLNRDSWNYASRVLIWIFAALRLFSIIIGHELNILLKVFRKFSSKNV
mgnify:CR=1 FL=1